MTSRSGDLLKMGDNARTIAIVLHDLPLGGSERIAVRLANRWAALGRRVVLFCGARQGPLAELIHADVEVVEAEPAHSARTGFAQGPGPGHGGLRGPAAARHPVRARQLSLADPAGARRPARRPAARRRRPDRHAALPPRPKRLAQIPYNLKTRWQLRRIDRAISLSDSMTDDANRALGRRVTQCIRLPALDDDDHAFVPPAEGKLILAAGRLVKEKGFDVALRAFARLNDKDARLVIVGEGERRAELEALAVELGVADRVRLPGYVPDIRPWLEKWLAPSC
jgi:glycosyltransferase involved in cell wall biosynthesis